MARQFLQTLEKHFPAAQPDPKNQTSLIGRLKPVLLKPLDHSKGPRRPLPSDASAVIEGRTLPRSRQSYAWSLISAWVADQSYGKAVIEVTQEQLRKADHVLHLARLPQITALLTPRYLGVRLPDSPRRRTGWASYAEALRASASIHLCARDSQLLATIAEQIVSLPLQRGRALVTSLPGVR